ncbi:MAG: class I adenylate-forming enzyme family protein [Chthoniobacterales bacterium]
MEPEKINDSSDKFKRKIRESNHAILTRWAETSVALADAPAIYDSSGRVVRTFSQIQVGAEIVAARLSQVGARSVIALQGSNSPLWIECLLGIWMADGIALLADGLLSPGARHAAEMLTNAKARIRTDPSPDEPVIESLQTENSRNIPECTTVDLIKLTSGTSGAPWPILFRADQLAADCDAICSTMGIRRGDLNFAVIAFSHSYGFSNLVTPLLCAGVPLVVSADNFPRSIINSINQAGATVLPAVPAIFESMAALEGSMPTLRLCISAGAPLRTAVADAFHNRFGLKLHSFYGASECGGICYDATEHRIQTDGFVGTPMDGAVLSIRESDQGRHLVHLKSPAVGLGSLTSPHGNLEVFDGFSPADWITGSAEHGYCVAGRVSDWINMAGRKVAPSEIEGVLRSAPAISDALVFGVDDSRRGQKICALVTGEIDAISMDAVKRHCESHLARWQVPREIRIVDRLPINDRGKISRRQIAQEWESQ